MRFEEKTITLRDGRQAVLRGPDPEEAAALLDCMRVMSGESEFLMRYPEEWAAEPEDRERAFLENTLRSDNDLMIVCAVDGDVAGICAVNRGSRIKTRHRAGLSIALKRKYWGLGMGTAMFQELIAAARRMGVEQLELEFIEGNHRARRLYEKMGFAVAAERPNAIRLKDGRMLSEFLMVREL